MPQNPGVGMRCFLLASLALMPLPALAEPGPLPATGQADYQLGGGYPLPPGVTIVARDSQDLPVPGAFNICYVNGFQTQPGEVWPADLLLRGPNGEPLADPNWPDEYLLDLSTPGQRAANLALILPAIRSCAGKGFAAIEFDNLDSYARSGGALSDADALSFAAMLVDAARAAGLAAGQKNAPDLGRKGRDEAGFAFAVAESCHRWQECAAYTEVYGKDQVIGIEYAGDEGDGFDAACTDPDRPARLILRDRLLRPAGAEGHVFRMCE